ncbi:esterase/lipase family protein [Alkalimonas mucilaginosa]|uniref:Alpha/beta hydrolase n=1 Tax=Alkalimonas mucilaginosa TaxID=3057676 RepID=A0ABU7JEU8_9GAMM|nr:alpha/beta hydrolase [Alkalimonas sp. MEB004]MEE2023961.1 alpha/beta hydrolase [Alkalimonas sp. MEB004]
MNNLSYLLAGFLLMASSQFVLAHTSSPFEPPEERLGVYVVNSGPGLDTGCTFRSGGPLLIDLPVPTVVNPNELNADGTLRNPQKLIERGVVGAQAVLSMPVWDVDSHVPVPPPYQPELNRVYFNGVFKHIQSGENNRWTDDSIVVPIEEVRFGQNNQIRIDIDTGNTLELWCTAVDWVAITFDLAAPVVLAHGINAQADTWDEGSAPGVLQALEESGVLYERFSVTANGRSAGNAAELEPQIRAFLQNIKADKVHVIAHSKGGLDTQELQRRELEFEILSLSTLSTPHLGSVAADMSIVQKAEADRKRNSGEDPNGFASDYIDSWTFGQGPQLPGLRDLTTYRATEAINLGLRGNIDNTFTIGANADANNDNELTRDESAGLFPGVAHYAARRAWRVMRDFSATPVLSIQEEPCVFCWGGSRTVLIYETILAAEPQDNDIVVTTSSANPFYGTALGNSLHNHSTVKNEGNLVLILEQIIPLR